MTRRATPRTRPSHRAKIQTPETGPTASLQSTDGVPVPLQRVSAHGRLAGLVFELTVEQHYLNSSARNLEAVFPFPLPLRAVLLGFDLEIGDRRLAAVAAPRQAAAERYERAIDDGNTAALLEHDGNGLYTVSLGNLMAGESAVIRYRYAEILDAHDGHLRLNVPTVIAPRYGSPKDAGLEGPTVPSTDLLAEYPFTLDIDLPALKDPRGLHSPSHCINTIVRPDGLSVALSRGGLLDRDFVLEIDQAALPNRALVAADGDHGYVMLASTTLTLDHRENRPLALKILLDCSGSMGGDSIEAARKSLLEILDRLTPADRLSLTRFGTTIDPVTDGLEPADPHTLQPLRTVVSRIAADLGGTEMQSAVEYVLSQSVPPDQGADVILITDGEIHDVAGVVDATARSGHRLFAIAIGAAPNEALARSLADKTGGACEFVGPNEDAEAAILRTFNRLRSTPRSLAAVQWPAKPDWTAPGPSAVFPGDTIHVVAGFSERPEGTVTLDIPDATGKHTQVAVQIAADLTSGDLLPRLAAARRLTGLTEDAARDLAVEYQLATQHTSFVVVDERAEGEKATDLPATVAVDHMMAAGWGGSASVRSAPLNIMRSSDQIDRGSAPVACVYRSEGPDDLNGPVVSVDRTTLTSVAESLQAAFLRREDMPRRAGPLIKDHGLPRDVGILLVEIGSAASVDHEIVVAALLAWIADHLDGPNLHPDFLAVLRGAIVSQRGARTVRRALKDRLQVSN